MKENIKRIDCHVHYDYSITEDNLREILKEEEADSCSLVLVPSRKGVSSLPEALMMKSKFNNDIFVFSNLDVSGYFIHKNDLGKYFKKYTKSIMKMGVDGIKMIEGKPTMRKVLPIPDFDSDLWDPFFSYCEKKQIPILWHVNDPEEFWDKDLIPEFALKNGWGYLSDDFINNIDQYTQIYHILEKHPNIRICFAHFFFMSKKLNELSNILDTYPNIMIDLTPGVEMYSNLSLNIEEARQFFNKYQDRIIYGTDSGARVVLSMQDTVNFKECKIRSEIVQKFVSGNKEEIIEADGNYLVNGEKFKLIPLLLNKEIEEKIYYKNYLRFVKENHKLKKNRIIRETKRIKFLIYMMSMFDKEVKKDYTIQNNVINYFKNKK